MAVEIIKKFDMLAHKSELSLFTKMKIVLEAVRKIETAQNELEAIHIASLYLEKLRYPHIMFSWLKTIEGELFVVGDPDLATGEKWKKMKVNLLGRTPKQVVEDLNHYEDMLFCRNLKNTWRISPIIEPQSTQ